MLKKCRGREVVTILWSISRKSEIGPWVVLLSSDGDRESEIRGMSPPVVVLGHQPGPFVNNARYLGVVWCFGWG